MAVHSGDSERGDADDRFASPRFTIAQLFELLLHIAQRSNVLDPNRHVRPPCLRCLERDMYAADEGEGRGVPIATAASGRSAAAETSDRAVGTEAPSGPSDPGDRRYWSNVSPGSSWMDSFLPDYLPDRPTTTSSPSRDPDPTASAVGVDADASSPASTYHSSRASSPSPPRNHRTSAARHSREIPTNTASALTRSDPRFSTRLTAPARTSTVENRHAAAGPSHPRSSASIPPASFAAPLVTTTTAAPVRFPSTRTASTTGPPAGVATRLPAHAAAPPAAAAPVVAHAAPPAIVAPAAAVAPVIAPAVPVPAVAPVIAPAVPVAAPVIAPVAPPAVVAPAAVVLPAVPAAVVAPAAPAAVIAPTAPAAVIAPAVPPAVPAAAAPAAAVAHAADGPSDPNQVWYVVTCGRRVGVFDNHSLVVWSVTGVRGNASRSFGSREEAERAFQEALDMNIVREV